MSAQEAKSSQVCHLTAICRSSTHRTSTLRSSAHQTENPSFLPSCVKKSSQVYCLNINNIQPNGSSGGREWAEMTEGFHQDLT